MCKVGFNGLALLGLLICGGVGFSCSYFPKNKGSGQLSSAEPSVEDSGLKHKTLRDIPFWPEEGRDTFRLSDLKSQHKAFVIAIRSVDCLPSESESRYLAEIEKTYSSPPYSSSDPPSAHHAVKFIYVYVPPLSKRVTKKLSERATKNLPHPLSPDSLEALRKEIRADRSQFGFQGDYVIDSQLKIASSLGAKSANKLFILSPERQVIYKGPVSQAASGSSYLNVLANLIKDFTPPAFFQSPSAPLFTTHTACPLPHPLLNHEVFFEDIAPIVFEKCTVCHNPQRGAGYMDFLSYRDIVGRGKMFRYMIHEDLMPPWHLDPNTGPWKNNLSLSSTEKAMLLKWADQGFQRRGKGKDPLSKAYWGKLQATDRQDKLESHNTSSKGFLNDDEKWKIPLPEPVKVPAQGFSNYKYFLIESPYKKDKWIKEVKFSLKPKLIHHLAIYIMKPSFSREGEIVSMDFTEEIQNYLLVDPRGLAKVFYYKTQKIHPDSGVKLASGAKLILEIHYEAPGRAVVDSETEVEIRFHKKQPKYKIANSNYDNYTIHIPPHATNHKIESLFELTETIQLVEVHTHMHLRGKASSILIKETDKEQWKRIFGLNPFYIKFERFYQFSKPLTLKKGSRLNCQMWYDNSSKNPLNPDPTQTVKNGLLLSQEMSICFLRHILPSEDKRDKVFFLNSISSSATQ